MHNAGARCQCYSTVFLREDTEVEATLTARVCVVRVYIERCNCVHRRELHLAAPTKKRIKRFVFPALPATDSRRVKLVLRQLHLRRGACAVHLTGSRHGNQSGRRYKKCRAPSVNQTSVSCDWASSAFEAVGTRNKKDFIISVTKGSRILNKGSC